MYCDNCGCELGPDMKVCPVCGKKVEDMAADNGNSVRMEDVASQVADVSKNEDEEGTTVLSADMLKNQGMPMPNPNGMPMPGPNSSNAGTKW